MHMPEPLQKDLPFALAFARFPKFGAKRLARMKNHFGAFEHAWRASTSELRLALEHASLAEEFSTVKKTLHPEEEMARLEEHGLSVVWLQEETYPTLLAEIHDPPPFLFYRGALPKKGGHLLSVVGSRHMSPYGTRVLESLIPPLVKAGVGIVSGLALGCDGYAHQLCVEAGGKTHGVVAGGCDAGSITPTHHESLAHRMVASGGSISSEQPIGTACFPSSFPLRNRLIAGMSPATLVIEATEASGSLITARLALEENREVLAVPGPIDAPLSVGTNRLIRTGAHVVTSAEDVLSILGVTPAQEDRIAIKVEPHNATEAALLERMGLATIHIDELVRGSRLPPTLVMQTLTALELREVVIHTGGNHYRLKN